MQKVELRNEKTTFTDLAYEYLLKAIFAHELRPGDSLRAKELAPTLGLSTTPIERALERLAGEGLVEFTPGKGAHVSTPALEEILELYEVREMIETFAVQNGIPHVDSFFLASLEEQLKAYEKLFLIPDPTLADNLDLVEADKDFHLCLISLWRNKTANAWYRRLHVHIRSSQLVLLPSYRRSQVLEEHRAIFNALAEKDAEKAIQVVRIHNRNAKNSFLLRVEISEQNKSKPEELPIAKDTSSGVMTHAVESNKILKEV